MEKLEIGKETVRRKNRKSRKKIKKHNNIFFAETCFFPRGGCLFFSVFFSAFSITESNFFLRGVVRTVF